MRATQLSACLSVFGARIGFDIPDALLPQLHDALAYLPVTSTDEPPTMSYRDTSTNACPRFERDDPLRPDDLSFVGRSVVDLVDDLHLSIALHATHHVFVHAGVVAWNGNAIIIPGRSRTGKSTLVHALVQAGATYLSDEYALATPQGTIAPYPRPIQLRNTTGRRLVDADSIGTTADSTHPPGLVVFTRFVADATFEPIAVAPASAALDLFDNTVIAEVDPASATAAVAQIARVATTIRSNRPNAAAVASQILELADRIKVTT